MLSKRSTAFLTADAFANAVFSFLMLVLLAALAMSPLGDNTTSAVLVGRSLAANRRCEEIYVVGEGDTLHTIMDKCGDPYILERNPHIHDTDDVFPGLVIMLNPSPASKRSRQKF